MLAKKWQVKEVVKDSRKARVKSSKLIGIVTLQR
jgi:hypothetical protein